MHSNRFIFFTACVGIFLFGVALITLGSVATGLQEKYQLDTRSSGALFSILPVGILTGSLLFGPFCDRYGYKIFLVLSCLCMFAGFQGIAFAPSVLWLKFSVYLFGFGGGAINGATNAVVADISKVNKGANLSLLGVSFAAGALGMPLILGALVQQYSFEVIVSAVGYFTLIVALLFLLTRFPQPKHAEGLPFLKGLRLLKDNVLLLIGFFLFCQSSFEGIINNWTTTYLLDELPISKSSALYALSLYVVGMAIMRLLIGSILRRMPAGKILFISFVFLIVGCGLMQLSSSYYVAVSGLILTGAGLAGGFPVMLGFVGSRYAELSGTAFSVVLVMALAGNMALNYLMGIVADLYGIAYLPAVTFILLLIMLLLSFIILKKINFNS